MLRYKLSLLKGYVGVSIPLGSALDDGDVKKRVPHT